jgi:putative PEP-CTERM system TPR-repeat lipoprotein
LTRTMHPLRNTATAVAALSLVAFVAGCGKSRTVDEYIHDAQVHHAAGDLPTAVIDLKNALQLDPRNTSARILLGRLYLEVSDAKSAEAELLHARQTGADRVMIAKLLAKAQLLQGKPNAVLKETELGDIASVELGAGLTAERGLALLALGRVEDARRVLQAGLAEDPHSVDVLAAMVHYALALRDLPMARDWLALAKREDPNNVAVWSLEGDVSFASGDFAGSEQAFQRVHDAAKWNLGARLGIARAQIAANKLKEAQANLVVVLTAAPGDRTVNYLSALLAFRQGDYATAQAAIQRSSTTARDFPPTLLLAGASSSALRQYEQANLYLGRYIYLVPENVPARKLLATVQARLGDAEDPAKTTSPALAKGTDDAQLIELIGVAAAQSSDLVSADRYLE